MTYRIYFCTALLAALTLTGLFPAGTAGAEHHEIPQPFKGKVHAIPGLIEAEHYDEGAPGIAYEDLDAENQGANYRGETQVDIEKRGDASNGYGIGWTRTGEWLVYTVNVVESGTYTIDIPVASHRKGGVFHVEMNGKNVTGPIDVPDTGGWSKLQTIRVENVILDKGAYAMKIVMGEEGPSGSIADIDYLRFELATE